MYPSRAQTNGCSNRYSAKNIAKPITFICLAPQAKHVSLIGDFNAWDQSAHPMKRQPDGAWFLQVHLSHGHHHYLFWIDGHLKLDPHGQGIGRNERNERVSMIAVS